MSEVTIRRVIIRGRVQGVGYRAWTQDVASGRRLAGWVRNRRDGTVEALFAGSVEDVEAMVAACRGGPRGCYVEKIEVYEAGSDDLALRRGGVEFSVLPTT